MQACGRQCGSCVLRLAAIALSLAALPVRAEPAARAFEAARRLPAELIFSQAMGADWREQWVLDGSLGRVLTGPDGLELHAGPEVGNDAHHVVLWTRQSFGGDVRIDYDYTRLDQETQNVNILYLFASGRGDSPYAADIHTWGRLRKVPRMSLYFDHMHLYHISYAAFTAEDADYVRARRYRPDLGTGLDHTALTPDYERTGLFKTGVRHHITVIRRGHDLFFRVSNATASRLFHWDTRGCPTVGEGAIGLRHMYGRSARYANFEIRRILSGVAD